MEANDQHLCIVPGRGSTSAAGIDRGYLPFEGDERLAVILAEDTQIKDPTITRHIADRR